MAALKPRKIPHDSNPRSPSERHHIKQQRPPSFEEVPIHAMQRPPEMRTRPVDPRMDPRRDQRPYPPSQRPARSTIAPRLIISGLIVVLIAAALVFVLMRDGSTTVIEKQQPSAPAPVSGAELEKAATPEQIEKADVILANLSKHILLPKESPQVMQITNPDELIQKDPFFSGSQSGDVLLIYRQAGKAIVFSPSRDIIVNVGPVQVDPPAAAPQVQ